MTQNSLLSKIHSPADLKALSSKDALLLAEEIRAFLIENVQKTGGHLASNLGVVELTLALHRVFDIPKVTSIIAYGQKRRFFYPPSSRRTFGLYKTG